MPYLFSSHWVKWETHKSTFVNTPQIHNTYCSYIDTENKTIYMYHHFVTYWKLKSCEIQKLHESSYLYKSAVMQNTVYIYINSLWSSDAIWRHTPWSTLVKIMAWCLMAPSHYLNRCWLLISGVLCDSPKDNTVHAKNAGHVTRFRWLGPNVWWEISQIYIEY